MGYTHYWYRTPNLHREKFTKAVADCKRVCEELDIPLAGWDGEGKPLFAHDKVSFNGSGEDDSHETFAIMPEEAVNEWQSNTKHTFACCKTARKPYDLAVQCCLVVFDHYFPDDFFVSSDGEDWAWQEARETCDGIVGYGAGFRLRHEPAEA
jgi:hypothetical protein